MFEPKKYAFQIETTVKAIFNCERYELGGIADRNFIERDPFIAIAMVLGNFYNKVDSKSKFGIDEFLEIHYSEMGKSMLEIGEEKTKKIVENFHNIVSTI